MPYIYHFDMLEQSTPRSGIDRRRILRHGLSVTAVLGVSAGLVAFKASAAATSDPTAPARGNDPVLDTTRALLKRPAPGASRTP